MTYEWNNMRRLCVGINTTIIHRCNQQHCSRKHTKVDIHTHISAESYRSHGASCIQSSTRQCVISKQVKYSKSRGHYNKCLA